MFFIIKTFPFLLNFCDSIFEMEMQYLRAKSIKKYFQKGIKTYNKLIFKNSLAI
jgi:hypothetical protein